MPATLATEDAARILGLHPRTVRRRAADGKIPAIRDNLGSWWFDAEVLEALRRQQQEEKTARREAARDDRALRLDPELPEWLSTSEAASILRVGVVSVRKGITSGTLPGRKFGNTWRVHRSAVEPPAPPAS